jgi:AraC-like DNA-binding protein
MNPNLDATQPGLSRRLAPVRTMAACGRIHFWLSGSLWIGQGRGHSEWHEHHAHQLALALDGELRFRSDRRGDWTVFEAALVPSHCPHQFEIDGAVVAHLFVEPESSEGRMLSSRFRAPAIAALPQPAARQSADRLLAALRGNADAHAMTAIARTALAQLAGTSEAATTARTIDARIARALEHIRSRVRAPVSLADAAAAANLSPSRFRHLFVQETGTSFRAYLLWLRINVAIEAAMAGASWTEAAHEAGFADSSHLTRTHKRMFGIEPTAIRHA